jgi:hypothetical protein
MKRLFSIALPTMALLVFLNYSVVAAAEIQEGLVVGAGNGSISMTDIFGENLHGYMVAPTARVILDGTPARLEELKTGDHVIVNLRHQDRRTKVVLRIDAHTP